MTLVTLTQRTLLESPQYKMRAEAFAARVPQTARLFGLAGLYLGDTVESTRFAEVIAYLRLYRSAQVGPYEAPYIPICYLRTDLVSFQEEPQGGVSKFFDWLEWVPLPELEARDAELVAGGWQRTVLDPYSTWLPTESIGGVPHQPMPYSKATPDNLVRWQTAGLNQALTASRMVAQVLRQLDILGERCVAIGCKRAFYSPATFDGGPVVWRYNLPGPVPEGGTEDGKEHDGGFSMRPQSTPTRFAGPDNTVRVLGSLDAAWCQVVRGLTNEGVTVVVAHERPKGWPSDPPGQASTLDWLPADLAALDGTLLFEDVGPERV